MADNQAPIAKAYVQVIPSTKGIKGKLSESFGGEGSSAGESFGGNFVSTIKNVMVAAGIGEIVKESLLAGADLQQSLGGVETLFKDSADIVIANAEQAYRTAGMSANQYMETVTGFSASLLQGLSGDTEAAAKVADMALTDMSDNANKMGSSMESIQNAYQGFAKQNYTMLDNLKLGYGGTKTEMERLLADAQKLTGVKYDISNLADVYEAIHVIQEEMGITGTTALEASSTFSGSLASMQAAASDLLANLSLGRDIGPSLTALGETVATFIGGNLLPMVGNLMSGLPDVLSQSIGMAIRGMNFVAENADVIVAQGVDLVKTLVIGILESIPHLSEAALNLAVSLGTVLMEYDWQGTLDETIGSLRDSMELAAGEILGTDGSIVDAVLESITTRFPEVLESGLSMIGQLADGMLENLPSVLESAGAILGDLLGFLMDSMPDLLEKGVEFAGELAYGLLENVPEIISAAASVVADLLFELASHLPDLLESGLSLIGEMAAGLILAIPDVLSAAGEIVSDIIDKFDDVDWLDVGLDIIYGIVDGLWSGVQYIINAAWSVAQSALEAAKEALGIASPSKVMRDEVGKHVPSGIAVGIDQNADVLDTAMDDLADLMLDTLNVDFTDALELEDVSMQKVLRLNTDYAPRMANPHSGNRSFQNVFHIYPSEGMDEDALAEKVARKIKDQADAKEEAVA